MDFAANNKVTQGIAYIQCLKPLLTAHKRSFQPVPGYANDRETAPKHLGWHDDMEPCIRALGGTHLRTAGFMMSIMTANHSGQIWRMCTHLRRHSH